MENASPFLPDWTWPLYSRRAQPCPQVPPWWAMTAYKKTTSLHCQQDNNNNNNNPAPRSLPAHPLEEWWYWHKGMEEQYWFSFFLKLGNSFYWHFAKVKTLSWKTFPEKHYNDHILKTWMQWTVPTFPSCFPSSVRMSTQVSESEGISNNNKSILPPTSTTGSTIIGTKASDSPVQWGVPVHWKHME